MVGVNKYETSAETETGIPTLRIDESVERAQVANLRRVKATRDPSRVGAALAGVRAAAASGSNLMPPIVDAARAYCTQQEICDVLRDVLGTYTDPAEF
jgi:methylmalonyl-CoA mutase N-terminal domain/subunit